MELPIFAQTLFFLTASIALIVIGTFWAVVLYQVIALVRRLQRVLDNLDDTADALRERIGDTLDRLETMPFLSFFFKKKASRKKQ